MRTHGLLAAIKPSLVGIVAMMLYFNLSAREKGRSMDMTCEEVLKGATLSVQLSTLEENENLILKFTNNTKVSLWFPNEQNPTYRFDKKMNTIHVWLGYFEEVHGKYASHYVVPPLVLVRSGEKNSLQLLPKELNGLFKLKSTSIRIMARVSKVEISISNVRGRQPLKDYLQHSCVVELST